MMQGLLNDSHNGTLSSKRVVTFLAFLLCGVAFIANLFWGFEVKQFMYESMIYLAMVGLGVTVTEKFAPINKESKKGIL
jgi:hypothetical protein